MIRKMSHFGYKIGMLRSVTILKGRSIYCTNSKTTAMSHFKRILSIAMVCLIAAPGFSQNPNSNTESIQKKVSSSSQTEVKEESSRTQGLRKIASYRKMDLDIRIDEAALEASIELAIKDALESVEAVLEKLEIHVEPIEINLSNLNVGSEPIIINIPDVNIDIEPIEIDMDEMHFDFDFDNNDWDNDSDEIDGWEEDGDDNDGNDKEYKFRKEDLKEKDKIKEKDKSDKDKSSKDKPTEKVKDKAKGLKKIN